MENPNLQKFLEEDEIWRSDTEKIVSEKTAKAEIFTREKGVLAGIEEAKQIFEKLDCEVQKKTENGNKISKGETLLLAEGPADSLLRGERISLNIISSMSGIATITRKCVEKVGKTKIAATRKTTPGYRYFEKQAVEIGGGDSHRYNLSESVLIKDNHIEILGLEKSIKKARKKASFTTKIEVEVETLEQAKKASDLKVDIILLDNMSPKKVEKCVDSIPGNIITEASGGITLENIEKYASTGVDVISIGSLTPSSWLDLSMKIKEIKNRYRT